MKTKITKLVCLCSVVMACSAYSEEINRSDAFKRTDTYFDIQIRLADVAGIGVLHYPSETGTNILEIVVTDYWTENPGTNIVRITPGMYGWGSPPATNAPVVFFATATENIYAKDAFGNIPWRSVTYKPTLTNLQESVGLEFHGADRAWFRTTRDNGIMYDYVTNLWDCVKVNPDIDRYYEVLRAGSNVNYNDSWRVSLDSGMALTRLFYELPEHKLIQALEDPLLLSGLKGAVGNALVKCFGWWRDENLEAHPPPKPE